MADGDDINLELKLRRCLIGINSDEGAFLSAALASNLGDRLSSSSLKKRLKQSGKGSNALLSALLWLSRLPDSEEAEAKVRTHYGLDVERSWSKDHLTWAISDALFVYPFYRMLNTLTTGPTLNNKVFAYKYSHRGDASLTQIITNGGDASSKAVSHFDEVLIQFENKVILALLVMGGPRCFCG